MPATSMYITQLDFYSGDSGIVKWQDYVGTSEAGIAESHLGLVGILPYEGNEDQTLIDSGGYADGVIQLHRYYRYEDEDYQFCYVYLTTAAMPTLISFTVTKGLVEWGWGNGDFSIIVYDTANEVIGGYDLGNWLLTEGSVFTGDITIEYVDREAGTYEVWNGNGYDEVSYSGGIQSIMRIAVYCDAGVKS